MNKETVITLEDVAARAGVSPATVSRCLNQPESVRPDKREKVLHAVEELGYVPHGAARALASNRSHMIGAIFPSLDTSLFGGMLEALQAEVADAGYTLVVASTGYEREKEIEDVRHLLASGVDALTLVGGEHNPAVYRIIEGKGIPYVLNWISSSSADKPCIGFDNRDAARRIAQYLLELGHQRFGVISGIRAGNDRATMRHEGIQDALRARGLSLPEANLIERPFGLEEGREAFRFLMEADPAPTAIICGSDPFAYGALFEAQSLGIKVPAEVSITGFDDMLLAAHTVPSLTTIQTPRRQIGAEVGRYLLSRLRGEKLAAPTPLETRLIVRDSTGPAPGTL